MFIHTGTYTYTIIYTFAPKDIDQSINPSIYSISSETKILEYFYTSHLRGLASWRLEAGWLYVTWWLWNGEFLMFWTDFISGRKASEFGFCKLVSRHFWQIMRVTRWFHSNDDPLIVFEHGNFGGFQFQPLWRLAHVFVPNFFPIIKVRNHRAQMVFFWWDFFELKKSSLPRYEKKQVI